MSNWKIAVLSDIHGNRWALEAVLFDIKKKGVDKIFNLGDSIYGPLDPSGTAKILMENDILSILGNQDRIIIENSNDFKNNTSLKYVYQNINSTDIDWLKTLKSDFIYKDEIYCCHGEPDDDNNYLLEDVSKGFNILKSSEEILSVLSKVKQKLIFCGHSHISRTVKVSEDIIVVNPGSVGMPAYMDDLPNIHYMESGNPYAKYSIVSKINNECFFEHIEIPYELEKAAMKALKNGFSNWEDFLRTGRTKIYS